VVARGEVWWVDFAEPYGSEPGFRRPAVIVSSDRFNESRIATVVVVILTSNLRLADAPGNVKLGRGVAGIPKASVINVSQVSVVDRSRLLDLIGVLGASYLTRVDAGLRTVLDL